MAYLAMVNPAKRRKRRKASAKTTRRAKRTVSRRRRNPIAKTTRRVRRRRNPVGGSVTLMTNLKTAMNEAAGALALDFVYGNLTTVIPASMQTGMMKHVGKVGIAAILGVVGQKVIGKKPMIANGVRGMLTVTIHDALKETVQTSMPSLKLSGVYDFNPMGAVGERLSSWTEYPNPGVGAYGYDYAVSDASQHDY